MSAAGNCECPCPDPEVVAVPGTAGANGAAGAAGANGENAFTHTTADFTIPAADGVTPVTIFVNFSGFLGVGQVFFVETAGYFEVVSFPTTTSISAVYLDYAANTEAGNTAVAGVQVSPGGTQAPLSAALPSVIVDNSTGTIVNTIAAGAGVYTLSIPIELASMTAAAADLVTNYVVGFRFRVLSWSFLTTTIGVGAGATMALNLELGSTNVTGTLTITEAGTSQLGEQTTAALSGTVDGSSTQTLSVEVAAGGTIFTAGNGVLLIQVRNMDTADAIAALTDRVNDLIAALT